MPEPVLPVNEERRLLFRKWWRATVDYLRNVRYHNDIVRFTDALRQEWLHDFEENPVELIQNLRLAALLRYGVIDRRMTKKEVVKCVRITRRRRTNIADCIRRNGIGGADALAALVPVLEVQVSSDSASSSDEDDDAMENEKRHIELFLRMTKAVLHMTAAPTTPL